MIYFLNQFISSDAYTHFFAMFDGYSSTPLIIKTFYSVFIVSFVLFIIRRIFWG